MNKDLSCLINGIYGEEMENFQEKVTFIWDLADLLRGVYKRNEYQKVILPFTVLKRFDCVLSYSKISIHEAYKKIASQKY